MACSIIILLYVKYELRYDAFHRNTETIYRITADGCDLKVATSPTPMGPTLQSDYSEIKEAGFC